MKKNPPQLPTSIRHSHFSLATGRGIGLSPNRMRLRDLSAPRYGVRVTALAQAEEDPLWDLREYAARMPEGAYFCGTSAARIYGLPLPARRQNIEEDDRFLGISSHPDEPYVQAEPPPPPADPIYVGVAASRSQPTARGITGRRLHAALLPGTTFDGLPVLTPLATFFSCCRDLGVNDAVMMLEALLSDKAIYPGLRFHDRPKLTLDAVNKGLLELDRMAGVPVARAAAARARCCVASPMETQLRLMLVDAGLPEPEINVVLRREDGSRLGEVDLLYRDARMVIEYEGDGHRTDAKTFQNDLERERRLRNAGFEYVRVTIEAMRNGGFELTADLHRQRAQRIRALNSAD